MRNVCRKMIHPTVEAVAKGEVRAGGRWSTA